MNFPTFQSPFTVSAVSAIVFAIASQLWSSGTPDTTVSAEGVVAEQAPVESESEPAAETADAAVSLADYQAELSKMRFELQIRELEATQAIASARLQVDLARADLDRYLEAERPSQERQLDRACRLAEHAERQARDQRDYLRRLSKKGYCKQQHVRKAAIELSEAQSERETAEARRATYLEHTHPRRVLELEGAVQEKQQRLEIEKEKAQLVLTQARAQCDQLRCKVAEYDQRVAELDESAR